MGSAEDASGGKRKRDEGQNHERNATKAARHATARQERLEREFAETYQGLTALYKLLEIKQLQSPLLLPRTLSYRLDKAAAGERKKTAPAPAAGADVREIKLGITSDLRETLARENRRLGLRLAIYSAKGRAFADNSFTLAADCMVPGEGELRAERGCRSFGALTTFFLSAMLQGHPDPSGRAPPGGRRHHCYVSSAGDRRAGRPTGRRERVCLCGAVVFSAGSTRQGRAQH
jgi:hypothetical protein